MSPPTVVAVDAMGGDAAPLVNVQGADQARAAGAQVILVGDESAIQAAVTEAGVQPFEIVHASAVIGMDAHATQAARAARGSSVNTAARLVREGRVGAAISAGNSGATAIAGIFEIGRIRGVDRPAIGGQFPTRNGTALLLDMGANADSRPEHLVQFARMGATYARVVMNRSNPRIGLVSIGEEPGKGNQLVQATFPLLQESGLNFVGNVEPKDVTSGHCDVAVCDGFTGNLVLKSGEAVVDLIVEGLRERLTANWRYKLAAGVIRPALRGAITRLDYREYGAAQLLGVRGNLLIAHGRSDATAIKNAILFGARLATADLAGQLESALSEGVPERAQSS
jgi:glycerol-3-phosphate acyltransferase PlsX